MNLSLKQITEPATVQVRIFRFNPAVDAQPRYDTFKVPHTPLMRIIDVLDYVHETLEVDIGYRWLCTSKKCGSCAVKVNGSPALACWDAATEDMTIEPLGNLPVIRDLVTSRDEYESMLARVAPQLLRRAPYESFPEPITRRDFAPTAHLRDCIQCLCCQSVCPVLETPDSGFAGPAVLVALGELAQDPRDGAERGKIAAEVAHVFKCLSCYECERVCPSEIPIVREAIEPLKRRAVAETNASGARRTRAFFDVVQANGYANGALVSLRANGLTGRAVRMGLRLLRRGKIDAFATLAGLFKMKRTRPRRAGHEDSR